MFLVFGLFRTIFQLSTSLINALMRNYFISISLINICFSIAILSTFSYWITFLFSMVPPSPSIFADARGCQSFPNQPVENKASTILLSQPHSVNEEQILILCSLVCIANGVSVVHLFCHVIEISVKLVN